MKKLVVLLFAFTLTLSSCAVFSYHLETGASVYPPTTPEFIRIYSGDVAEEYIVIGSVTADVVGRGDAAVRYLKTKAAKLGADAIIKVELNKMHSYTDRTGISGVAIKFK